MRRSKTSLYQKEFDLREAELNRQIASLRAYIEKPKSQQVRRRVDPNTMGPPDEIVRRRQNRRIHVAMGNGRVQNTRRELRDNVFLLVLLVVSIAASGWWIFNLLKEV